MGQEFRRRRRHRVPQARVEAPQGGTAAQVKPSRVHVIGYGPSDIDEEKYEHLDRVPRFLERWPVTWVHVDGLGDRPLLERVAKMFGLHPLSLEDVVHVHQRAKVEEYGEQLFIVVRRVALTERLVSEQISMLLGRNFLLTFEEGLPGECFDEVRQRLRAGRGNLREHGPDHLMHALIDAVVDSYFPVLEEYGERLDVLDEQIGQLNVRDPMHEIHLVRGELLFLRRVLWPHREALVSLTRDPSPLISDEARVYLRDCYDHVIQIIDLLQSYRDVCTDLRDYHLSAVSNRTNEIMRVLTIISTIFIPLSFIAGVWGMNFQYDEETMPLNMPELHWPYGYPMALGIMLAVVLGMLAFFWRRGWIGSGRSKWPGNGAVRTETPASIAPAGKVEHQPEF